MKKRIAVTAPTSSVASGFINYIQDKYDVITIGRRRSDVIFDFSKDDDINLPEGISSIVHFAGSLYAKTDENILDMVNVNINGALRLCMLAKKNNISHVVNVSSINSTLSENSTYYGWYSLTKKQSEEATRLFCGNNNLHLCTIRPSQIIGTDNSFGKTQPMFYMMIENAKFGKDICIYGKHDAKRNYLYSENLYRVIEESIKREAEGTIDVIDPHNYSLHETADMIISEFESDSKVVFCDEKSDLEDNGFVTGENIFKNWSIPFVELNDAIKRIVCWYKYM